MGLYRDPYQRLRELAGVTQAADSSVARATPEELATEGRRAQSEARPDLVNAFRQGVEDIHSSGVAARGLARIAVGDSAGGTRDLQQAQELDRQNNEFGPAIQSYDQVHGVGDAVQYAGNSLARLAPQIGLSLGTGLAGGVTEAAAGAAGRGLVRRAAVNRLSRAVAQNVAGDAERATAARLEATAARRIGARLDAAGTPPPTLAQAFTKGSTRGAVASGILQQASIAPDIVLDPNADPDTTLGSRALAAGTGAVITGALDALPIIHLFGRYGLGDGVKKAVSGSLAKRLAVNALKQGAEEGSTELAQAVGEELTHKYVNKNHDLLGPDAMSNYINSAAAGFLGGGFFGAPGGLRGAKTDSAPGKAYAQSFRDYMGKFKRTTPNAPADGGAGGAATDTGDGFDLSGIADKLKSVIPNVGKAAAGVGAKARDLASKFMSDDAVENSIHDVLNAKPFEAKDVGTGVMFNEGNGIDSVKKFVDAGQYRALRAGGLDHFQSVASSFVPNEADAVQLHATGAIDEAAKALRGVDPSRLDEAKISAYQAALPEDARTGFNRVAHTAFLTKRAGKNVEIAPDNVAQTDGATGAQHVNPENDGLDHQDQQAMDAERPLPPVDKRIADWRSKGGKPIGAEPPENALVVTDDKGTRRALTGQQLGRLITEHNNEDPQFAALPQEHKVAVILGDFHRNGFALDPKSLRTLKLGNGWHLTAQQATALSNSFAEDAARRDGTTKRADGTPRFALQQQTVGTPTPTGEKLRALNDEYGKGGGVDTAGAEDPLKLDEASRAPQPIEGGTPRTGPVVVGGEQASPTTRERAVSAAERDVATAQDHLDRNIATALAGEGADAITGENRRALLVQAMNSQQARNNPELRSRLQETAQRYAETRDAHAAAVATKRVAPTETPAHLLEGRTEDAGKVDAEAAKAERDRRDNFNDLDRLLTQHTGVQEIGFDNRRALYKQALADKSLKPHERAAIVDAAERFGEAMRSTALKKVARLTDAWRNATRRQKEQPSRANSEALVDAYKALRKAHKQLERANASAEIAGTPHEAPSAESRNIRAAQAVVDENTRRAQQAPRKNADGTNQDLIDGQARSQPVENDAHASQSVLMEQVATAVESRSRRALYDLKNKVFDSTMSETTKSKLLQHIDAQLAALRADIHTAGVNELSFNSRRDVSAAHFDAVKSALQGKSTMTDALNAVREHANETQKALIDALLKTGALKGVAFEAREVEGQSAGLVGGEHQAGTRTGQTLNSRVALNFSPEANGASVDGVNTLLHEAIHAVTTHAEQANPKLRAELEALLTHVRAEATKLGYDVKSFYGLSETQEFLAEAFTNPTLQNILRQITAPDGKRTMWDAFKDFVAKIVGVDRSALDAVFELGSQLARETADARNAQFESIFGDETAHSVHSLTNTPSAGAQPTDYMAMLKPNERRYLEAAFRRGTVYRQVQAALPAARHAELASADLGPTLLVNTGIALALQGRLDMTYDAGNFKAAMQGLWELLSKVLQIPSKTAYARAVLHSLATGTPAGQIDAQALLLRPAVLQATRYIQNTLAPKALALTRDMDARLRTTGVPALTQLATLLAQRTGEFRSDRSQSFSANNLAERNKRLNQAFQIIGQWDDAKKKAVLKELQTNTRTPSPEAAALRGYFKDMRDYLVAARVLKPDQAIEDYFPVSMSPEEATRRAAELETLLSAPNFAATLQKRGLSPAQMVDAAQHWYKRSDLGDVTFADGDHDPSLREKNPRLMDFIYKEGTPAQIAQFASFQDQSLDRIVVQYTNRAVRRAEWTKLDLGKQIKSLMAKAATQGATPGQLSMARDYIDMMMGTYGHDWNPFVARIADAVGVNLPPFEKFEKLQAVLTTYQNLRLLPLSAMSSLIDPLGVAVRNGGLRGTWDSYKAAAKALLDQHGNDALRALAESMGLVERHAVAEALVHTFGSIDDPTGRAAKINGLLFKANGLEAITRFSRLAALAAANNFIKYHASQNTETSTRYLTELGLTRNDVRTGPDGYVVRNEKIDAALNRFVNEAVIRPTTGQRTGWQNDPNFQLAAQYKGYLYSFFNTITRRAAHELDHGNAAVLLPLLLYLPITALGEFLRDFIQRDGKNKGMEDYAKLAVTRSGLLGPQVGALTDTRGDWSRGHPVLNTVGGPTGQQLGKAYDAVTGEGHSGNQVESALPYSSLFKSWN